MNKNTSTSAPVQLGLVLCYPSPGIAERIAPDWDWVWLDGQHGQLAGYDTMLSMVRAVQSVHRKAFVRVPGHEAGWISLAADMCANAIIVPQVDTEEQARAVVRSAKFPPHGNRSFGGRRPIDLSNREYYLTANSDLKVICQIESEEALNNAGKIAAVDGVDGLFLGPDDYLLRKGIPIATGTDQGLIREAAKLLGKICRDSGQLFLSVGMTESIFRLLLEAGATHIVSGGDVPFLANGSKQAVANARSWLGGSDDQGNASSKSTGPY
jgi:4-hydroxy-2-oxoheptanedioate aldolase